MENTIIRGQSSEELTNMLHEAIVSVNIREFYFRFLPSYTESMRASMEITFIVADISSCMQGQD